MQKQQLDNLKAWMDNYIRGFYGDDEFINANLKLKEDHTRRTCGEMIYLIRELALEPNDAMIAETTALFHDVARFEQFALHRTYKDWLSFNHCERAVGILEEQKVLDALSPDEKKTILRAIEVHGLKEVPADLDGHTLLFAKMLRDADKLDIFFLFVKKYIEYKKHPEKFKLEVEYTDEPTCTPEVVDAILAGQRFEYSRLKTLSDMRLMQLGWVYDINFTATLKRLKKRKLLQGMAEFLPETGRVKLAIDKIFEFVNSSIKKDSMELKN